jgi:hypothetical protein
MGKRSDSEGQMSSSGCLWWIRRASLGFLATALGACGHAQGDFGTDGDMSIWGGADGSIIAALQPACGAGVEEACRELDDGTTPAVDGGFTVPEVACGSETCTLDDEVCCQYDANVTLNPVYSFACVPLLVDGAGRPAALSDCSISLDRKISCDEPSDCRSNEICCSNDNQGGTEF